MDVDVIVDTEATGGVRRVIGRAGPLLVLVFSASCLAAAPAAIDRAGTYSWLRHTTSESAAQGVGGAWVARVAFVAFAVGVAWTAVRSAPRWGRAATTLHGLFSVAMIGVAAFSSRPWTPAPYDVTEDRLHSIFASVVGTAFALGVVAVAHRRRVDGLTLRAFDVVALVTAVLAPLTMSAVAPIGGAAQRAMFAVAYLWYGNEALDNRRARHRRARHSGSATPRADDRRASDDHRPPRTRAQRVRAPRLG